MRRISTKQLLPGMKLAQPVMSSNGNILLAKGQILRQSYIDRLVQLQIRSVYIVDPRFPDVEADDFISEQSRLRAMSSIRQACTDLIAGSVLDFSAISDVVDMLIDDLAAKPNLLVNVFDIRAYDDYTYAHSVNVCSFSILIGICMRLNKLRLRELAVGALMHDLGKIIIPAEVLNKPGPLTAAEFEQVKQHSYQGFEILRQQGEIGLLSAHVALQHHERIDGTGYPRGLAGTDIHEYGRIVAVADVYDALVSDRAYRPRYLPHQAAEILVEQSHRTLDDQVVKCFLRKVAFYPIGTVVRLSTGVIGVVVDVNQPMTVRPVVRILYDAEGNSLSELHEVDLTKDSHISIIEVVSDEARLA